MRQSQQACGVVFWDCRERIKTARWIHFLVSVSAIPAVHLNSAENPLNRSVKYTVRFYLKKKIKIKRERENVVFYLYFSFPAPFYVTKNKFNLADLAVPSYFELLCLLELTLPMSLLTSEWKKTPKVSWFSVYRLLPWQRHCSYPEHPHVVISAFSDVGSLLPLCFTWLLWTEVAGGKMNTYYVKEHLVWEQVDHALFTTSKKWLFTAWFFWG